MIKFFNFFNYSNLFISLCATSFYLLYALKADLNFFISTPVLVFCLTYIAYHLLRFIPYKRGLIVEGEFKKFYEAHPMYSIISILIAFITSLYCLQDLSFFSFEILILCGVIVLLYERIIFKNFNLRMIPYSKPFFVALVWALMATGLNGEFNVFHFSDAFIFITLMTIPFDLKDLKYDQFLLLKTIPMKIPHNLSWILSTSFFVYSMTCIYLYQEYYFIFGLLAYPLILKWGRQKDWVYYLGLDGLILLRFLLYLI